MKLEIEVFDALCSLSTFITDGVEAEEEEFVDKYDHCPDEEYGCGNMEADIIAPTEEVLEKYNISPEEHEEIAAKAAELVSFGACGWCV